jgi:hypothetical protein
LKGARPNDLTILVGWPQRQRTKKVPGPQFRSQGTSRPAANQFFIQILRTTKEAFVFESLSGALALNVGHGVRGLLER